MTDPAQVEATPRVEEFSRRLDRWYPSGLDTETGEWLSWPEFAIELERELIAALRQLSLAQTENAGHIRIEDELKADLERERMRVVGCSVAALGNWKEGDTLHADYDCVAIRDVAKLRAKFDEAQARCAELEKLSTDANIAYGSLWNDRNSLQEKQDILVEFIQKIHDQAHARWKKEARSILAQIHNQTIKP